MKDKNLEQNLDKWILSSEEINFIKNGGKLVFHLPKFHIVDKSNYKFYLQKKFSELSYNY